MTATIQRVEAILIGARECDPLTAMQLCQKYSGSVDHDGEGVPFVEHMEYNAERGVLLFTIAKRDSHAVLIDGDTGERRRHPKPLYLIVPQEELFEGATIKPATRTVEIDAEYAKNWS